MMRKPSLLPLLALLLLAGCADKSTKVASPGAVEPVANQPVAGATDPPKTGGANEEPKPAPAVPDNLKHEAFQYYGLGNTTPQDLEVRVGDQVFTGTETYELVSAEQDRATFTTSRTGQLATQLGNETILVTPKGIQIIGTSQGKFEGTHLVPANLAPGTTWTADVKITQPAGSVVTEKTTWRVVGVEKVSTKAGTFDALRATTTGTINFDGTSYRIEGKTWYAKGVGVVKVELSMVGDETRTVMIEAI